MNKKRIMAFFLIFTALMFANLNTERNLALALPKQEFNPSDTLNVVTTIGILQNWAYEIGKGLLTPISIVSGLEDPHTYEMTTQERELLSEADVLIRLGIEGLESWLSSAIDSILEDNPDLVVITLANESIMEEDPAADESFLNPHVWMSPIYAKSFVKNITTTIISLDPENEEKYLSNRDNYLYDLDDLIKRINDEYKPEVEELKVVVHHPSFMYLFDLLGIERVAIIEEQHETEPSPEHIQNVINEMKEENVKTIVVQPQFDANVISQIVSETGAKIASLSPLLPAFGLTSYISLIEYDIYALQNPENFTESTSFPFISAFFSLMLLSLASWLLIKKKK
ncbi:MAG: metal ABC transporter substrate-binding protein [Candidatus Heimdallarchaeaceae archaeon]|nr:MAG: hypothetical protein DRN69_08650 [Candidatus Pacearchaeota archaeon]